MGENKLQHEGGCLCGATRYTLHSEPTYCGNCHCRSCQRAIGAGMVTWVGVKPENFEVNRGEISYCETSPGVQRGFCGHCGTSLTYGGDDWTDIGVTAASLDDPSIAKPESNVYLDHKQSWILIDKSLRQYEQLP